LLAWCTQHKFVEELILWCNALLVGGNHHVQDTFLAHMVEEDENMIIHRLKSFLSNTFDKFLKAQDVILKSLSKANARKPSVATPKLGFLSNVGSSPPSTLSFIPNVQLSKPPKHPNDFSVVLQRTLRFLQLLCEGHHSGLQNFLRDQSSEGNSHKKSFDLVTQTTSALSQYAKVINVRNTELGLQILETIIEVVQGPCMANQEVLCLHTKVIENLKDIISSFKTESELGMRGFPTVVGDVDAINNLKRSSAKLLISLLEGQPNLAILNKIARTLEIDTVRDRLEGVFRYFVTKELNANLATVKLSDVNGMLRKHHFDGDLLEGFDLYSLMNILAENVDVAAGIVNPESFSETQYKAYEFFSSNSGSIEIIVDGNIQKIYFPINPVCKHLTMSTQRHFLHDVKRDSPQSKTNDLMEAAPDLIDEMYHNESLNNSKIQITPQRLEVLENLSTFIAFTINGVMLSEYEREGASVKPHIGGQAESIVWYLGYGQLTTSSLLFFFWIINKASLYMKQRWRMYVKDNEADLSDNIRKRIEEIELAGTAPKDLSLNELRNILYFRGPEAATFKSEEKRLFASWILSLEYGILSVQMLFENNMFKYYIFYISVSFMGKYMTEIFYTLHLLDIIKRNATLRNVMTAVTLNHKQLLWTAFLCLVIVYIYSVLGFFLIAEDFYDKTILPPSMEELQVSGERLCDTLFQCFFTTMTLGLRNGGGIADSLTTISYELKEKFFGRIVYDLTFFIIVVVIFLNIIFGIIIDTFAQLRDEKMSIEEDLQSTCFICHMERYTFDRNGNGFDHHIANDHNVWQYIFYLVHLQRKDPTDFTGVESYVMALYNTEETNWIPQHRALVIDGNGQKESFEDTVMKILPEMRDSLSVIAAKLQ